MQEDIPYLYDYVFYHQYAIYDANYIITTQDEVRSCFQAYSKKKKSVKSLKNICTQTLVNNGTKIEKNQIPNELIEYIRLYICKHRKLFPTFTTRTIIIEKLTIKHDKTLYGVGRLSCSEYYSYIIRDQDSKLVYWLSDDLDRRLNLHVTSYIKRSSNYNYKLRKSPHVDQPFLDNY